VWYLTKLAKEGRSRGFLTVFVTQKQTAHAIPTAIRDAHVLGFRGHFSTKSRRYSTTLTALRQARREWRNSQLLAALGYPENGHIVRGDESIEDGNEDETMLAFRHWQYIGRGHSPGEAIFARTIAYDLAENRRICRRINDDDELAGGQPSVRGRQGG
jgi:hypothetical protein